MNNLNLNPRAAYFQGYQIPNYYPPPPLRLSHLARQAWYLRLENHFPQQEQQGYTNTWASYWSTSYGGTWNQLPHYPTTGPYAPQPHPQAQAQAQQEAQQRLQQLRQAHAQQPNVQLGAIQRLLAVQLLSWGAGLPAPPAVYGQAGLSYVWWNFQHRPPT